MTWKGILFLFVLLLSLGGVLRYADPELAARILDRAGLSEYAEKIKSEAHDKAALAGGGGENAHGGAPIPAEFERGPHNGRMLRDGPFAIEVTIFETGVPPEFHFYAYQDAKPLDPSKVEAKVELARIDGQIDQIAFKPEGDYLKGSSTVVEPHSFDVTVNATYDGKPHQWKFGSYEGRTSITEEAASVSGLKTEKAGPAKLIESVSLTGTVMLNQNKTAQVKARFPGVVRKVVKNVGEPVKEGDVLAIVESNVSLQNYDVKAPFAGVILERNTNLGDVTGDQALFVITDLSTVWAEFHVFSQDLTRIKAGQKVKVRNLQGDGETENVVTLFTPVAELSSQSILARVTLDNSKELWRPGMTVRGDVTVGSNEVPLAVRNSGLQRFRDFTVVFGKFGTSYEVRMLDLGMTDGTFTEVKDGLKPGTEYVAENSFLVKADVEKSGASHDH